MYFPSFLKQKRRNRKPVSANYLKCRLLNCSIFRRTNQSVWGNDYWTHMFTGRKHCLHFLDVPSRTTGVTEFHIITEDSKWSMEQNLKYKFKIVKINLQR